MIERAEREGKHEYELSFNNDYEYKQENDENSKCSECEGTYANHLDPICKRRILLDRVRDSVDRRYWEEDFDFRKFMEGQNFYYETYLYTA